MFSTLLAFLTLTEQSAAMAMKAEAALNAQADVTSNELATTGVIGLFDDIDVTTSEAPLDANEERIYNTDWEHEIGTYYKYNGEDGRHTDKNAAEPYYYGPMMKPHNLFNRLMIPHHHTTTTPPPPSTERTVNKARFWLHPPRGFYARKYTWLQKMIQNFRTKENASHPIKH